MVKYLMVFALVLMAARDWQTGKVLDPENSPYYAASAIDAPYGNSQVPITKVYQPFLIEGPSAAYFARQGLRWERSKPAELKPNGTVKFAVDGNRLYVIDDAGKQHRLEIVKTVPRKSD